MKSKFKILYLFMVLLIFATGCKKITADFEYDCGECKAPCEVTFTNLSENADSYIWDFGDGENSLEQNPVHTYNNAGTFTIKLTAIGDKNDIIEKEITIGESNNEIIENPNPPQNNGNIISQNSIADASTYGAIYQIENNQNGKLFFSGYLNTSYLIGEKSLLGSNNWINSIQEQPNDVYFRLDNFVFIYGIDSDLNSNQTFKDDKTKITFFEEQGINQLENIVQMDNYRVNLYAFNERNGPVEKFGGSFIGVGYAIDNNENIYPFMQNFHTIAIPFEDVFTEISFDCEGMYPENYVFQEHPGYIFQDVITTRLNIENEPTNFYFVGKQFSTDGITKISIFKYQEDTHIIPTENFHQIWKTDLLLPDAFSTTCTNHSLIITDDALYFVGTIDDTEKASEDGSNYWNSGIIARIDFNGNIQWIKKVSLSEYSDELKSCLIYNDKLYVFGQHSGFGTTEGDYYSNALVLKVNISNGNIEETLTFGDKTYGSGFNTGVIMNNSLFLGGWTNKKVLSGNFQDWFVVINP